MTELLQIVFLCSLWCLGFHYATLYTPNWIHAEIIPGKLNVTNKESKPNDTEILWFVRYYTRNWPKYLTKPICGCVMCMSSLHGSLFYWGYVLNYQGRINGLTIVLWVVTVVAISGTNRVLKGISQI